jgi:hypothetical protein
MHGLVPMFNEKYQKVEIARNQAKLAIAANECPTPWRKRELGKTVARQTVTIYGDGQSLQADQGTAAVV